MLGYLEWNIDTSLEQLQDLDVSLTPCLAQTLPRPNFPS